MNLFIIGIGLIAPNWDCEKSELITNLDSSQDEYLVSLEPEYKEYFNIIILRRLNRLLKMGITAAKIALKDAKIRTPGAVIIGTGLGCLEDTITFLNNIIDSREGKLNPTAFIQSTHNSIASLIALQIKCYGYNATYSHRGLSFEYALIDAAVNLNEGSIRNILIGGADEMNAAILNSLESVALPREYKWGESAGMFLLSNMEIDESYCRIENIEINNSNIQNEDGILRFLEREKLTLSDIDLIFSGKKNLNFDYSPIPTTIYWKNFSGESMTSIIVPLSLAALIIKSQDIPAELLNENIKLNKIKRILIYNKYHENSESMFLLTKC